MNPNFIAQMRTQNAKEKGFQTFYHNADKRGPWISCCSDRLSQAHSSLCPIDNIMHYLATLCSGYCGLQPGVPQAILWSLNIHHSAGDKHCCHLALLQMPLQHSVILCLHLWKEINVNMTIYGIHSFWAAPRTGVFVFPYCYGAQLQYPHMMLPLTGGL